jgi:hypothetical protein
MVKSLIEQEISGKVVELVDLICQTDQYQQLVDELGIKFTNTESDEYWIEFNEKFDRLIIYYTSGIYLENKSKKDEVKKNDPLPRCFE